jgi:hypothetical protein
MKLERWCKRLKVSGQQEIEVEVSSGCVVGVLRAKEERLKRKLSRMTKARRVIRATSKQKEDCRTPLVDCEVYFYSFIFMG